MKKIKPLLFYIFIISFSCANGCIAQSISNYKVAYGSFMQQEKTCIVLRSFENNKVLSYLVVNPNDLSTSIHEAKGIVMTSSNLVELRKTYANTPYIKALADAETNSKNLQDAGVTHSIPHERGINLTIDLCPSHKNLDRIVFTDLINEFKKIEIPVPMAISISGRWIEQHDADLEWLKGLIRKGDLTVDWINHTYSHPTNNALPLDKNFMLEHSVNISDEILKNEVEMLTHGITPSVFFRFPGLVSDRSIFLKVTAFGIIPVGSDAWLAKGQQPHDGSFVLIHGNGNEPLGVIRFIQLLKSENINIKDKKWELYDLRGSLIQQ
ncbi:MAG: polysaccharide deacetylase [Chitinophagaceae bacterium]|nr:polysaccharide deacetylase [Chitinophagaceae bacterium]